VDDAGRIITAGDITSGMEKGSTSCAAPGTTRRSSSEVAGVMEYNKAYELYCGDREEMPR
jgi:hypothetical protein